MTTTALTSELEAINTMLAAVGESPINSLEVSGLADVAAARAALDEISREVQTVGWHFNTEEEYPLLRGITGRIGLQPNCLKAGFTRTHPDLQVVQRGAKLYDKKNHTDIFTADLKASAVFLLAWDELPQVARHYIMIRASRIFQTRTLGSDTQFRFSHEEEEAALKALHEAEGETGGYNVFGSSSSVMSILER